MDENDIFSGNEANNQVGSSSAKRMRDKLLKEATKSVPESGFGKVKHLVKAFKKILSIRSLKDSNEKDEKEA